MIRETVEVGVVVERRALKNPWVDHAWVPVAVLVGVPAAAPWTALHETTEVTRYYAGKVELEFFGTDTTMYRENLRSQQPSLWVSLRHTDAPPGVVLHLVTADPSDAESLTETGTDIIEAVSMPVEVQQRLAAFVEAHHVERPFVKRKRDPANPEALARREPSSQRREDAE
ncbi:DUF3305 domain-containing protein [Pseudaminobacter sp. 19-2017]|uniref:DUF3305 domain-containing protein n=1 Tax=Pseudaminobacter soli (ex Zhang et al. 2022) TaxID=2831468 RepID=A0A942I1C5_9HYPH|nr:DUF3305 domain-containing protein [Pseudaminobacter soli]MBS3647642.1 DUF3305 domain-containing protein [Pseudaminobacter soli]